MRKSILDSDQFWIGCQLILFAISGQSGVRHLKRAGRPGIGLAVLAAVPVVSAAAIAANAKREIGDNLTMAPTPVDDGYLVDSGVYGFVRHPMYLSAILGLLSWAMGSRAPGAIAAVPIAALFFDAKARHEEGLLRGRYPQYDAYAQRVAGRILPLPGTR
ncbi:MAG: isoprenylcysteine carboxylmethyltransferase family protein [Thermomicrobiales bacterium]|nr:isoprenylcysteine carboxylmethyltransferase family protein [Thermomicrobiales bacterium]